MALFANAGSPILTDVGYSSGRVPSKTKSVTPILANVDHYLSAWQVLKKSVRGNILGANVLKVELLMNAKGVYSYY